MAANLSSLALRYIDERTKLGHFRGSTPRSQESILLMFCRQVGTDWPSQLTHRRVELWLAGRAVAPATMRTQLSAVKGFCRWLVESGVLKTDPSARLRPPRQPRSLPRGLQAAAVAKLFQSVPDPRAEVVISLMVQEGLRCCEVASLQVGDVDLEQQTVRVRGKGDHERLLPLSHDTALALARYSDSGAFTHGPLIRSLRDPYRGVSANTLSRRVGEWMTAAGIKGRAYDGISAHALRHTCATDMLRGGAHLRDVQAALGHASLVTTQRYLPFQVGELRVAMGGRSYRA